MDKVSEVGRAVMLVLNSKEVVKIFRRSRIQYILCYYSTEFVKNLDVMGYEFQYILCYCSTMLQSSQGDKLLSFNTSYVTVQQ